MIYINLLLIAIVVCFIVDLSGFVNELKRIILKKVLKIKNADPSSLSLKPFDCSLCAVWWSCLIYLLITDSLTFTTIAFTAVLSFISPNISGFLGLIKELLTYIESKLYTKIT